jgi:Zn finger protein HypA/HybF involved in hydrogenase expression
MSAGITCPRCGKSFEVSNDTAKTWGSCPHCGAANPQAVKVLGTGEPLKQALPSTSVTAEPPRELLSGMQATSVSCPHCRKLFAVPVDRTETWLSCPHCHELNVDAMMKDVRASGKDRRALGILFVVAGTLGLTVGTCLSGLGMAVRHIDNPGDFGDIAIPITCVAGSLAIIIAGAKLISVRGLPANATRSWGELSGVVLVLVLFGVSAWIVAFTVCSAASSGLIR